MHECVMNLATNYANHWDPPDGERSKAEIVRIAAGNKKFEDVTNVLDLLEAMTEQTIKLANATLVGESFAASFGPIVGGQDL